MSRRDKALVLALTIWALAAAFPGSAEAASKVLHTAIVAGLAGPEQKPLWPKQFAIAADVKQTPTQTEELQFPLQSLPKDVTLTSCAIRLVMAERYPKDIGNEEKFDPVLLGLFKAPLQGSEQQPVAAWAVPPKTDKYTAIILRSGSLCKALTPGQADPARFVLQTSVRQGRVVLFGQDDPSDAPRLLLTYTQPNALPGEADWSQIRRDAQHSGRSPWRMYDPGGTYTPADIKVYSLNGGGGGAKDPGDLRRSPLLYGGEIFNALPMEELNRYQLVARDRRSGQVLSDVKTNESGQPISKPTFLVAGGNDRLYYFSENQIVGYNISSGSLVRAPEKPLDLTGETLLPTSTPTLGVDGSLYVATNNYVRAYSPAPEQKLLWRYSYPTTERQVGAVALSKDETTSYILLGGADTRLVALDSATGDCRWQHKAPDFAITRETTATGSMPIPVVAGNDILVTSGFPTGDKLYVFHDEARKPPTAGGEMVPPASALATIGGKPTQGDVIKFKFTAGANTIVTIDYTVPATDTLDTIATGLAAALAKNTILTGAGYTFSANGKTVAITPKASWEVEVTGKQTEAVTANTSCRADGAPGGMDVRGTQDHIPAPVAGPGADAYNIRAGKLCRSLNGETCADLTCEGAAATDPKEITLLIGDNSAGDNSTHLYGLAAAKKLLFFISVSKWPTTVACRARNPGFAPGANLILAPDGTLYNVDDKKLIQVIAPTPLPGPTPLTLTADLLTQNPETTFRVPGKIEWRPTESAPNLTLGPGTDIILVAGESITFGAGFKVEQGAQLRARVGLAQ